MKDHVLFQREEKNAIAKMHWRKNLLLSVSTKLVTKHTWMKGTQKYIDVINFTKPLGQFQNSTKDLLVYYSTIQF